MKEQLTIFDENHRKIGEKERNQVHLDGDWHETFHCWFWKEDLIYLQRRSMEKQNFPGKYDVTAAGRMCKIEGRSLMTNHLVQITQADLVPHRLTY